MVRIVEKWKVFESQQIHLLRSVHIFLSILFSMNWNINKYIFYWFYSPLIRVNGTGKNRNFLLKRTLVFPLRKRYEFLILSHLCEMSKCWSIQYTFPSFLFSCSYVQGAKDTYRTKRICLINTIFENLQLRVLEYFLEIIKKCNRKEYPRIFQSDLEYLVGHTQGPLHFYNYISEIYIIYLESQVRKWIHDENTKIYRTSQRKFH